MYSGRDIILCIIFVGRSKMSSDPVSNSLYDDDNNTSEKSNESSLELSVEEKIIDPIYSSGSNIGLSENLHVAETSKTNPENSEEISVKTDSIKSLWSTFDVSKPNEKESNEIDSNEIVPKDANPFIYDGKVIRYNTERGVDNKTPVLFGSHRLTGTDDECGYRASHFVFDPKSGSLAAGYDINNSWARLANFSLISGVGNSAELDGSFISGSHNKTKLELLPEKQHKKDAYCAFPPSCAIIGGDHNSITNTSASHYSSVIIGSSHVKIGNCENVVILGMKNAPGQEAFENLSEATVSRNLYGIGHVHAGPFFPDGFIPPASALSVNGDAYIHGNINANNISQNSAYIAGTGATAGAELTILPNDGVNIVYANPVNGRIDIHLGNTGVTAGTDFASNRSITFKDTTLEAAAGSANDIYIWAPAGTRIESYLPDGGLTAADGGAYKLNTSGGSVTFSYAVLNIELGTLPTWVIQSQFEGNARLLGVGFSKAGEKMRVKLLEHKK